MEAREKALETTKVVNQKGLTLDPDKPIVGGTQEGIETIKTKCHKELRYNILINLIYNAQIKVIYYFYV